MQCLHRFATVWILFAGTCRLDAAERTFRYEPLRGEPQIVSVEEFTDTGLVLAGPQPHKVPLTDVVALRRESEPADWRLRTSVVWLSNGDRLIGDPVLADEEFLSVRWLRYPARDALQIPLERVVSICAKTPASTIVRRKLFRSLVTEPQRNDVAWLATGDRVSGEFNGLTAEDCIFHTEAGNLPIRREQLAAVRFNPQLVTVAPLASPRYVLTLSDGSRVTAERFVWTATQLTFSTAYGVKAALPADALVGCQIFSDQIQPVSELKPDDAAFTPYLGGEWPWVKNRNVLQGPLEVRGREFATGLGVHSQMAMTYALGPKDREFRSTVGIDDCAEGKGHVVFTILVDGRPIWQSPGVTGISDPVVIPPVDLRGGKHLTLQVDFGEQGDVADYADWCDALILREP